MALVDPNKPHLNLVATLRTYEHAIVRHKDELDEAKAVMDTLKREVDSIVRNSILHAAGVPPAFAEVEVKLSRPAVGENPELRVAIIVTSLYEVKLIEVLRAKKLDFKVTVGGKTKKWGNATKVSLVLHEYLNHAEARMPRPLR